MCGPPRSDLVERARFASCLVLERQAPGGVLGPLRTTDNRDGRTGRPVDREEAATKGPVCCNCRSFAARWVSNLDMGFSFVTYQYIYTEEYGNKKKHREEKLLAMPVANSGFVRLPRPGRPPAPPPAACQSALLPASVPAACPAPLAAPRPPASAKNLSLRSSGQAGTRSW